MDLITIVNIATNRGWEAAPTIVFHCDAGIINYFLQS